NLTERASSLTIDIRSLASHPEGIAALASFAVMSQPQHGQLSIDTVNWLIIYTPNAGYSGPDSFTFNVTDVYGVVSNLGTINLSIKPLANATAPSKTEANEGPG